MESRNRTGKARVCSRVEDATFDFWLGLGVLDLDLEHCILDVCTVDTACVLRYWVSCLLHEVG